MSHLVCKKHNRRVMTFEGKVIHRSDGSHCKGTDLKIGDETWQVVKRALDNRYVVINSDGYLVLVPKKL